MKPTPIHAYQSVTTARVSVQGADDRREIIKALASPGTVRDLANRTGLKLQTVQHQLTKLHGMGLVQHWGMKSSALIWAWKQASQ